MAEEEAESTVNRWVLDYYISLAMDLFKNDKYEDFCQIRNVIEKLLIRPVASSDILPKKVLVIQLLSRINEGENLDVVFENCIPLSPLESALMHLESMHERNDVSENDLKRVCILVKVMIVKLFIRNEEFDKAKVALRRFPKSEAAMRKIFMDLISKRSNKHKVIEEIDFKQLKDQVAAFCQEFCQFSSPFLQKAAKQLSDRRALLNNKRTTTADKDQCAPSTPNGPQVNNQLLKCDQSIIPKERLAVAYKALTAGGNQVAFCKLEEEVENETTTAATEMEDTSGNGDSEELFQRNSGGPLEAASPTQTDAPPPSKTDSPQNAARKRARVPARKQTANMAKMVMDPDSQASLVQASSQEQEAPVTADGPMSSQSVICEAPQTNMEVAQIENSPSTNDTVTKNRSLASDVAETPQSEEQSSSSAASKRVSKGRRQKRTFSNEKQPQSDELSSDSFDIVQDSSNDSSIEKKRARNNSSKFVQGAREVIIPDSSLDCSPSSNPRCCSPQKCSTPNKDPSHAKWKKLYANAKESKVSWTEEDERLNASSLDRTSSPGGKKRKWTDEESQMLKEGVKKFGEGNWSKIKSNYSFNDRTNVQLKDRWRTMRKLNLI